MKKIISSLIWLVAFGWLAGFMVSCSNSDATDTPAPIQPVSTQIVDTLNVDVILPPDIQKMWQPVINLALDNIAEAQKALPKRVFMNLRYHDENAADLDKTVYRLCFPEAGDDTCHLILGPYRSSKAEMVMVNAAIRRVPVLMPVVTSDELQRVYSEKPNTWFFTESDVTACDIILNVSSAQGLREAALFYTDDRYGNSFRNWFGYMATEYSVNVEPKHICAYGAGKDVTNLLEGIERHALENSKPSMVLMAFSTEAEYLQFIKQVLDVRKRLSINESNQSMVMYVVPDVGDIDAVHQAGLPLLGLNPAPSSISGFDTSYYSLLGTNVPQGGAQVYDALMLAALGAAKRAGNPTGPDHLKIDGEEVAYRDEPFGPNLSDWMRALVADKTGEITIWNTDGLRMAFNMLSEGKNPNVNGTTGKLLFDAKMHSTILQTTYWLWHTDGKGSHTPLITLSTHGENGEVATLPAWEWQKAISQQFNEDLFVWHKLPVYEDYWALLVTPSTTWANYRHQADVMAMYQLLRRHGYDDDHIVVVCEDNLANASQNVYPGKVYVENQNEESEPENVHEGFVPDYHFSDIKMEDIRRIILGDTDGGRLPHVLHTTEISNIFIFWSGHGADGRGMCWNDGNGSQTFTGEYMRQILEELNDRDGYRRCMLAIETCFSGLIGDAIVGLPDVVAITAANKIEPSKADVHNRELGVFLSNAFARSFRKEIDKNYRIKLRDLYYQLALSTSGSHVTLYNEENYGSVYYETTQDFFPE